MVKHHLMSHHPLLLPLGMLTASWTPIAVAAPADAKWIVLAFAANGVITVLAAWLLLRQYVGTLLVGAQGYDRRTQLIDDLKALHERELDDLRTRQGRSK